MISLYVLLWTVVLHGIFSWDIYHRTWSRESREELFEKYPAYALVVVLNFLVMLVSIICVICFLVGKVL